MGKCVAYVAAAAVCLGVGALVAGIAVWYTHQDMGKKFPSESRTARCVLEPTVGYNVRGTLTLIQTLPTQDINITGTITGLTLGLHGFHVHQWGVAGAGLNCTDAAGHYNPGGFFHAGPNATDRHVGDLGNILSELENNQNIAQVQIEDKIVKLWGERSVVGRAIVVHAGVDDLGLGYNEGSTKTGNAGGRVACCTIHLVPEPKL